MKICFTSAIIWDNAKQADVPKKFEKDERYDYHLFTNVDCSKWDTSWDIVKVDLDFLKDIKKNIIKSRYFKFTGWKYIKEVMGLDYDVIFFCDATRSPEKNTDWEGLAKIIMESESGIAQRMHVSNPYHECDRIVKFRKDTRENADKTKEWLQEKGIPEKMKCYENTAFGYSPKNEKLLATMTEFWDFYKQNTLTHRDQPIWSYMLHKNGIEPYVFDTTGNRKIVNKYFPEGGKQGNNSHRYV
jgi:RNA polymerase subunit RPABC4/transcription elongation factor Spt4